MPSRARIVDVVFEERHARRNARLALGVAVALAFHALLWLFALSRGPSLETWSAELAVRIHQELDRQDVIEVAKPTPPPPPPPAAAPVEPVKTPKVRVARARPPPPARAGSILAQAPRSEGPVDLTGDTFVTGTSQAYVGGVTSSSGTNEVAVHTTETDPKAPPTKDFSQPVSLDEQQWQCAWPPEADSAEIDRQAVVIRVTVKADGSAAKVDTLSDPGFGFAAAARACALRTRFQPARDKNGTRIAAVSPPIRVRFTR
jgi:periplasmic protein TonB